MSKLHYNPKAAHTWWRDLSIDEKVRVKKEFEVFRNLKSTKKMIWPNMFDLRHIRISQLSDKHIVRLWVFKDRI